MYHNIQNVQFYILCNRGLWLSTKGVIGLRRLKTPGLNDLNIYNKGMLLFQLSMRK